MRRNSVICWICGRGVVAGKCSGYGGHCDRYYCAAHQIGNCCQVCGERKAEDERQAQFQAAAEQLWHDRQKTRNRSIEMAALAISLLLLAGGVVLALFGEFAAATVVLSVYLVLFLAGLWRQWGGAYSAQSEQNRVLEIEQDNPGFANFYLEWSKEKLKTSG